jgi:hypothetical protein
MKLNYGFIYRRARMPSPPAEVFIEIRHIGEDFVRRNRELLERVFAAKWASSVPQTWSRCNVDCSD